MTNLTFRCECGQVEGSLKNASPHTGNHMVCYCDDCQAYAAYLGDEDKWLDEWGGTDVFQVTPASITFLKGSDKLRCVRVKPGGIFRFYSSCCRTPIANTVSRKMPFAGIPSRIIHGNDKEAALGPVRCYVMGTYARGQPPTHPHPKFSLKSLVIVLGFMLKNKLKGANLPTPFFRDDGKAVVAPDPTLNPENSARQ